MKFGALFSKNEDIDNIIKAIENKTGYEVIGHSATKKQFNDSSLGLPKPGHFYMQVITPGYVIDVKLKDGSGKEHKKTYHSNLEGSILKEKP